MKELKKEEKLVLALQENREELKRVRKYSLMEEAMFCEGYESAMLFVLGLYGIDFSDAFAMEIKVEGENNG